MQDLVPARLPNQHESRRDNNGSEDDPEVFARKSSPIRPHGEKINSRTRLKAQCVLRFKREDERDMLLRTSAFRRVIGLGHEMDFTQSF